MKKNFRVLVSDKISQKALDTLQKNNIRLLTIGNTFSLPKKVYEELNHVIKITESNTGMVLNIALSYGSRDELTNCMKEIGK